ncbi:hypothetical protein PMAYCL1PPCAC_00152, partial [Pristionchus mayeri]
RMHKVKHIESVQKMMKIVVIQSTALGHPVSTTAGHPSSDPFPILVCHRADSCRHALLPQSCPLSSLPCRMSQLRRSKECRGTSLNSAFRTARLSWVAPRRSVVRVARSVSERSICCRCCGVFLPLAQWGVVGN